MQQDVGRLQALLVFLLLFLLRPGERKNTRFYQRCSCLSTMVASILHDWNGGGKRRKKEKEKRPNSKHWFTTSFLWRKVPESEVCLLPVCWQHKHALWLAAIDGPAPTCRGGWKGQSSHTGLPRATLKHRFLFFDRERHSLLPCRFSLNPGNEIVFLFLLLLFCLCCCFCLFCCCANSFYWMGIVYL